MFIRDEEAAEAEHDDTEVVVGVEGENDDD
jgi:hypothetical protein